MFVRKRIRCTWIAALVLCAGLARAQQLPQHLFVHVTLAPTIQERMSGRLLIFLAPGNGAKRVDAGFVPEDTHIAAREVQDIAPGQTIDVDTDELAYPAGFSALPAGDYQLQAVLDRNHSYAYSGRGAGDVVSDVVDLHGSTPGAGGGVTLVLNHAAEERQLPPSMQKAEAETAAQLAEFVFPSEALTRFWGRPIEIRGYVVLPPNYQKNQRQRYPTVYWTAGFGGNIRYAHYMGSEIESRMRAGKMPEMIWVMLDQSFPTGTHEFADSVNNGPWGEALTRELIPHLESKYRMDGKASGRFLTGHSSGGWTALWLQVAYPREFGGTWPTSPDPSDFRDFTGVDLYAPHANMYRKPNGEKVPLVRIPGRPEIPMEDFAKQERILGSYGGQMASFEWVFSPKGPDGSPMQVFDRITGDIDPKVAIYWGEHYDIARKVRREWPEYGKDLKGKIHLTVGTADTFHLEGPAHLLEGVLKELGGEPRFRFLEGRTHGNLFVIGNDQYGLLDEIAREMYAAARPAAKHAAATTGK